MSQREIKFRFWNKIAHRFQHPSKCCIDGEGKLVVYDYEMMAYDDPTDFSNTVIVAQQYTGLKDNNGVEIYEGDIVERVANHVVFTLAQNGESLQKYTNGVIKFFNAEFKVCQTMIGATPLWDFCMTGDDGLCGLKVIGNIFEHPELVLRVQ